MKKKLKFNIDDKPYKNKDRKPSKNRGKDWKQDKMISKANDWRWYATNPQSVVDTASFAYGYPLGSKVDLGPYNPFIDGYSIPGIMRISTVPAFGWADSPNSAVNIAAANIYSYVRHANSGHSNYDAPDLMLYLLAMDSVYSVIEWAKRIYGLAMTWNNQNKYFPRYMIESMNVDFDSIQTNLNDYRAYINMACVRAGSLCVPANMSYFAKHKWMYQGIYVDDNLTKAQVYYFNPEVFTKFTLDSNDIGQIVYPESFLISHRATKLKYTDIISLIDEMLAPIISDEDFNIMSGDILKAYGSDSVVKLEPISEGYIVMPSHDPLVLNIIRNTTLCGPWTLTGTVVGLSQDMTLPTSPYLKSNYRVVYEVSHDADDVPYGLNALMSNRMVSFDHDKVSPEEALECTRFTNIATSYYYNPSTGALIPDFKTVGSEFATQADVFYMDYTGATPIMRSHAYSVMTPLLSKNTAALTNTVPKKQIEDLLQLVHDLSVFNLHPEVSYNLQNMRASVGYLADVAVGNMGFQCEMDNYTILDSEDLIQMSEIALIAEFSVTQYGRSAV